MNDQSGPEATSPDSGSAPAPNQGGESKSPANDSPAASVPNASKELTPDEQMALYEEDLKENDWGHQPC